MNHSSALDDLGVTVKGIVGDVSSFFGKDSKNRNSKEKKEYFRLNIWDGGKNTFAIISESNGLGRGDVYHGRVEFSIREYKGVHSLSCFEVERL